MLVVYNNGAGKKFFVVAVDFTNDRNLCRKKIKVGLVQPPSFS